jgi:hypothetical protein
MKTDETRSTSRTGFCAYCGHPVRPDQPRIERFGQSFCSDVHADDFTAGVREARMTEAAARPPAATSCRSMPPAGQRTWIDYLKRSACWGAPLLLLLALPLIWSGSSIAAAGGSLLSVVALLACPLGMFFMMRSMAGMSKSQQASRGDEETPTKTTRMKGEH